MAFKFGKGRGFGHLNRKTQGGAAVIGTWNPSDKTAGVTLASGNLQATLPGGAPTDGIRGTTSHTTGKWYYEAQTSLSCHVGFASAAQTLSGVYSSNNTALWHDAIGASNVWSNNGWRAFGGTAASANTWFGLAIDLGAGKFWRRNAAGWDGDPAAGTGGYSIANLAGLAIYPYAQSENGSNVVLTANFGASAFAYTAPSGFSAWG
jgi:hypothetical protein